MEHELPLNWFVGDAPGVFRPSLPGVAAGEERSEQQFVLALDRDVRAWRPDLAALPHDPVRRYAEHVVRTRLHQLIFRDRVLLAYERQCALSWLRHAPMLDAAHIRRNAAGGSDCAQRHRHMCAVPPRVQRQSAGH